MTYTELKKQVVAFSHRNDIDAQMDTFVLLSETVINKSLRVYEQETRAAVSYPDRINDLPADFMLIRSLLLDTANGRNRKINQVTPEQLIEYEEGQLKAFTIQSKQIEIVPPGDATNPVDGELVYYAKVPTLTANESTDILTNYPMVYLSAMMVQVNLFVQDTDQMAVWDSVFNDQLIQANGVSAEGRLHLPAVRAV